MEKIFRSIAEKFGSEEAVNFALNFCNVRAIRGLAESVQELPIELKAKLAEKVIKSGDWHDAYYFLQLVRDIPEPTKDRLLDKAEVHDPGKRNILRMCIV